MRPFAYQPAQDVAGAVRAVAATARPGRADAEVQYLAGGTTLIDLMKLEVLRPQRVIDLGPLSRDLRQIEAGPEGLRLGAMAKMSAVADHPDVLRDYPVLAQSLHLAASAQLRNMATLGGNVLQRTRCPYYRDPSYAQCNKREPGSGCSAIGGMTRNFAVLGVDDSCIAQYPGDFGVALIALDGEVELAGPDGARVIPFSALHRDAAGHPEIETTLKSGEMIIALRAPYARWLRRSLYLKIRDRESYEFALASAAVALDMDGPVVREARIGLGGVAYKPWRAREAEAALVGKPLDRAAAEGAARTAFAGAKIHGDNGFKPELGRRTLVRALLAAKAMEV